MSEKNHLKHLRSKVSGKVPASDKMIESQLAMNIRDKKLFTKDEDGNVIPLSGDAPLTVVDEIVTSASTSISVSTPARYLVQRKNGSAFSGLSGQERAKLSRSPQARHVATITISGTATGNGTYRILGRSHSFSAGNSAANILNGIDAELSFIEGSGRLLRSTVRNNLVLTITWNAFEAQPALPTFSGSGITITTAVVTQGGNGDDLWGVLESDGTNWRVADVADNINYGVVSEKNLPARMVQPLNGQLRTLFTPDPGFASAGQYPNAANPATATTNSELHVKPSIVKEMFEGLYKHEGFDALDARPGVTLNKALYKNKKSFYVVAEGDVTLDGTTYNMLVGDTIVLNGSSWAVNRAADESLSHKEVVTQNGHGFNNYELVYLQQSSGNYVKAKADNINTCGIIGMVTNKTTNTFEVVFSGIIDDLSGLTKGATYYVSQTTAGAFTATVPNTGIVKFAFQALDTDRALVLPMIAYDAGSSSGGGSSYTRQQIIDSITQSKTEGADKYLAGDGTFKSVGNLSRLFSTVQTAGTLAGGVSTTYSASGSNVTVTNQLNGQIIRGVGILPAANYNLILNNATFLANGVSMILNQASHNLTVTTADKNFFDPTTGKTGTVKSFVLKPGEFAILVANASTAWHVMHSDASQIDDTGATSSTSLTYSISKILSSIQALINDSGTSSSKTWSSQKIVQEGTFQQRITAGANQNINSGQSDSITINQNISNKHIDLKGVYQGFGFDVNLAAGAWTGDGLTLITNTSNRAATLKSVNNFRIYNNGRFENITDFVMQSGRMVLLYRDTSTNRWSVMESGTPKWLDDSAAGTATGTTYSAKKITDLVNGLIADATASSAAKTWSINKIKSEIKKVKDLADGLIDDTTTSSSKTWSSNEINSLMTRYFRHKGVADSLHAGVPLHFDAHYRSGIELKKFADISGGKNVNSWDGKGFSDLWMDLPNSATVTGTNRSSPGYYAVQFDGSTTYGIAKKVGGNTNLAGSEAFPDRGFVIVAVVTPKSFPSGVQESDLSGNAAFIHNVNNVVLGLDQNSVVFGILDTNNNQHVIQVNMQAGELNDRWIIVASVANDGDMSLQVQGVGDRNRKSSLNPSGTFRGGDSGIVEIGRGHNNKNAHFDLMELLVQAGDGIQQNVDDYFDYFGQKWGINITK